MDSPERGRSYSKRNTEDTSDYKNIWGGDEEERVDSDMKKDRSRSSRDRNENRKRSGGSSRADSDEDDYELRKEQRSKQMKKMEEESSLEKLSSWYEDGEQESRPDCGDNKKRYSMKLSENENSRSKSKEEKIRDADVGKYNDRDSKHSERRERSRERSHSSSSSSRRRRWDEADHVRKVEEIDHEKGDLRSSKTSDSRREGSRERSRNDCGESKSKTLDLKPEKGVKSSNKEDREMDIEKSKNRGKSEGVKEDNRVSPVKRMSGRDVSESVKEVGQANRSRTPERSGRRHHESESSEVDHERGDFKLTEQGKDGWRDDRDRDQDSSKVSWRRRRASSNEKDSRVGDIAHDYGRERDFSGHGRDWNESERPHGRPGGRKDGNRGGAVKTLSSLGVSSENYDVIEIQTKPLDNSREGSGTIPARRTETGKQADNKSADNDEDWEHNQEDRQRTNNYRSGPYAEEKDDFDDDDYQGGKGRNQRGSTPAQTTNGQTSNRGSQPQGIKGNRPVRGGKGRPLGRDNQQGGMPLPMMGPPFGHLGMPSPGSMQPLAPGMSPIPGASIPPGVFIPSFSPPIVWPGARGVDGNILGVPPSLNPIPTGPSGPRFHPTIGTPPNAMYFNPPIPERGGPQMMPGPSFDASGSMGRGMPTDKIFGSWVPPRTSGPPGKAPSRGEQNDYSQNFVDTGMRPQNFIRELELTNVEDYPKLRELIQKKDEIVANSASAPMYMKCDLREFELSPEFFGTKFDVILVDPPWEEYVHRAPGVADNMEYWTFEEIINLKIEAIADTPSFIFLWVGDGVGLEQGRQCLKKWGFRRCEDICWVKTNKNNATPTLRHDSRTVFQRSKEHCLMGIKGTVRRSTDGHIIHANIDTDVIIAEEPPYGSTEKPEDMYRIIEHFALGRRRLELFGEDHNIRSGWLTVGKALSSSNFNAEGYIRNFSDKDGKVWQGGGGRNPPPEAPHLVLTTPDIESLRPKSPMKNQNQNQQQSNPLSLTTANSFNRRTIGNSPQNPNVLVLNQEASGSNFSAPPPPWVPPATMDGFRAPDGANIRPEDKSFDMYAPGYNRLGGSDGV